MASGQKRKQPSQPSTEPKKSGPKPGTTRKALDHDTLSTAFKMRSQGHSKAAVANATKVSIRVLDRELDAPENKTRPDYHPHVSQGPKDVRHSLHGQHEVLSKVYGMRAAGDSMSTISKKTGFAHKILKREVDHPDVIADYQASPHASNQPYVAQGSSVSPRSVDARLTSKNLSRARLWRGEGHPYSHIARTVFGTSSRKAITKIKKAVEKG